MPIGFGNLLDSIAPGKTRQHFFNLPLASELQDNAIGNLSQSRTSNLSQLGRFSTDIDRALANIRGLDASDQSTLGGLINNTANQDPLGDYRTIRGENLNALKGLSDVLGNVGRRQQSLNLASMGLGGGAGSSYQDILNQSRVNTAIAPIANSIFNNLATDATSVNNSRLNNLAATLGLMSERANVPVRGLNLRALPINLQNLIDNQYLLGLDTIGNTSRNNTAGFEYRQSPLGAAGGLLDGLIDTALSAYTMGLGGSGGGGGGGMFGGMFGGGQPPIYQVGSNGFLVR